jgi:cytochrome bd-type quinol oxidase subunit 2
MSNAILFKSLIFILIILILLSLTGGLFFLTKDKGKTNRTVYSLTIRVILSVSLFLLLILGFATGQLQPHGVLPQQSGINEP